MARYQWNDINLKKKAQRYYWLAILCALSAVAVFFVDSLPRLVLVLLLGAIVGFVMSVRTRSKDAQLKRGRK